jgi:two-component system, sensor histidine kinase and response regulator
LRKVAAPHSLESRHKLLARQLRRSLGLADDAAVRTLLNASAGLAATQPEALARLLRGLPLLLERIDESYVQFDRDLTLGSRSLEISSKELLEANARIRDEASAQQRVAETLQQAVDRLAQAWPMRPPATRDSRRSRSA